MANNEKFCLKWNDFRENVTLAFRSMREDQDFSDVTLVCEDGQQIEAHKVILAAASPLFQKLLKGNKHPHPMIFMRGMNHSELVAIADFLYHGEANIFQDNLDAFLKIAEEFQLKGLTGGNNETLEEEPTKHPQKSTKNTIIEKTKQNVTDNYILNEYSPSKLDVKEEFVSQGTVAIPNKQTTTDFHDLDEQIKSLMGNGEAHLGSQGPARRCTVCGKEGKYQNIKDHIEANHITGVSHPCNLCEKTFRSRPSLRMHKHSHRQ